MVVYRKRGLRFGYLLHDGEWPSRGVDLLHIVHRSAPVPGGEQRPASTVMVRLGLTEEALRQGLPEQTAYEIRRSLARDKVVCGFLSPVGPAELARFTAFYAEFARIKGYPPPLNGWWLETLRGVGCLWLSVANSPEGRDLVFHAYVVDGKSCRLLHSASVPKDVNDREERNLLGRANRLLHWQDMLHFKAAGLLLYDFGGWSPIKDDPHLQGINRFKESFGGEVVFGAHCDVACSLRGRVWMWLQRQRRQWRQSSKAAD